jgi:hypothetical protein
MVDKIIAFIIDNWQWVKQQAQHLIKAWLLALALSASAFGGGMYYADLIHSDPGAYWRLSNSQLKQEVFKLTVRLRTEMDSEEKPMRSYRARGFQPDMKDIDVEIRDHYDAQYRLEAIPLIGILEERLSPSARVTSAGTERELHDICLSLDSYNKLRQLIADLDDLSNKLPRHRSFLDWLEGTFLPSRR